MPDAPHHVVVFGTTDAAVRAVERYARTADVVDVVWHRFSHDLQMLGEGAKVRLIRAKVQEHSVVQFFEDDPLVVPATGDPDVDATVRARAEDRGLVVEEPPP